MKQKWSTDMIKDTEIKYVTYELGELLSYEQPTPYIVESTDYNDTYKTPVLTAGKSFILGYTNEENNIYNELPVIIFDDFTTASRYVNFPFKVKSSAMKILTPNTELVIPKYIFYRMQIIEFDHSTHKRYWIQQYSRIKVTIPPITEQQRIVDRIEELFSQLESAVETLQKTKQQLAVYRQAVLKEAFENCSDNSKEDLIQSVCSNIVDCPHSTPKWVDSGKLCLRTTNFKRGYLDLTEKNYVSEETFNIRNARLIPLPGDVLYSREGAILGIACIIPKDTYVCLGQRMMLFRTNERMNGRFLMHYLNSPRVTSYVTTITGGSASPHINVGDIKNFKVPVPSITQQEFMLEQLEAKLSVCDNIEKTVDTALRQAEAMRQSILKKAFEGKL